MGFAPVARSFHTLAHASGMLRHLPIDRITLPEQAVQRLERDILLLPRGAERERLVSRLDPRGRVVARRAECGNFDWRDRLPVRTKVTPAERHARGARAD